MLFVARFGAGFVCCCTFWCVLNFCEPGNLGWKARLSEPGFSGLVDFQDWEVLVSMFLLKVDGYFWNGMLLPSPVGTQCC